MMKNDDLELNDFKDLSIKDMEIEDKHYSWSCCCFNTPTDSRLLKFCSIYVLLLQVFIFCIFMLYNSTDCTTDSTYLGLLTFIIGLIIPTN